MNDSKRLGWTSLFLAIAAVVLALLAWRTARRSVSGGDVSGGEAGATEWLRGTTGEKLEEVERQLRGLDVAMVEIGYRFGELYFAGQDGNWEYARYQAEKIQTALERALVRRPKRAESARPFLEEELPAVMEVIARRDADAFLPAMERFRTACMKCHTSESVPYFTVEFPEARVSTIRTVPGAR